MYSFPIGHDLRVRHDCCRGGEPLSQTAQLLTLSQIFWGFVPNLKRCSHYSSKKKKRCSHFFFFWWKGVLIFFFWQAEQDDKHRVCNLNLDSPPLKGGWYDHRSLTYVGIFIFIFYLKQFFSYKCTKITFFSIFIFYFKKTLV